jgi:hypothetical protein
MRRSTLPPLQLLLSTITSGGAQQSEPFTFSPPVLIAATPGKDLGADAFVAIDVDPAGDSTLLYGASHYTSYDSGACRKTLLVLSRQHCYSRSNDTATM